MTQTVTHTGFGLCGTNGAKRLKSYFCLHQKGRKSPQRSGKPIQTAAHNPEVGGSSPPPATIKSLEIKRFQGFFLFSNRKVSDQASGIPCTKFGRFGGQNLVQNRWGMCRSSHLPDPSVDLKSPAAFCAEGRVRQAVFISLCSILGRAQPSAGVPPKIALSCLLFFCEGYLSCLQRRRF